MKRVNESRYQLWGVGIINVTDLLKLRNYHINFKIHDDIGGNVVVKEKQDLTKFLVIGIVIVISLLLVYYVVNFFSTGFRTSGQEVLYLPEILQSLS